MVRLPEGEDKLLKKKVKKLEENCRHDISALMNMCNGLRDAGIQLAREVQGLTKTLDILEQRVERLEKNSS